MPDYLPERFEAGTLPTPSIVSLRAGLNFINSTGIDNVKQKLDKLSEIYSERISSVNGCKIFGCGGGIIAFDVKDIPSELVAKRLDNRNIYVRSGLHCAPMTHETLGSSDKGLVRVSLSILNTEKGADALYKALCELV
jgi:selenocysteine lyase/cysteine desulfurase